MVKNWLRNRETIEFLGIWESLHNPDFKQVEFDLFRSQAGLNAFTMSPMKWIEGVNAIGIIVRLNYRIHTDAIKENLIPPELTAEQISHTYANEADLLNVTSAAFRAVKPVEFDRFRTRRGRTNRV